MDELHGHEIPTKDALIGKIGSTWTTNARAVRYVVADVRWAVRHLPVATSTFFGLMFAPVYNALLVKVWRHA